MKLKTVVVLPTYNEKENIASILEKILHQQYLLDEVDLHILVVDDSSPDGTAEIVEHFQKYTNNIHLLGGQKKNGLGAAYINGFTYAIETLNADILVEMDADFSHDPSDLPRLITEVINGNDFVIGSRYVQGGSIPNNWSVLRKTNSKFGNILARHVAGLGKINDCTGGFRAIKASLIKKISLKSLRVKGYAFQISLLHAATKRNAKIIEIPIHFTDRVYGHSKIRITDVTEFIKSAVQLRFPLLNYVGTFVRILIFDLLLGILLIWIYSLIGFNINLFVFLLSILMILQGSFTLWWMLYAWNHPESVEKNKSPKEFSIPTLSFSAIVPARHEEKVIASTIDALSNINYPEELKETIIVCKFDDVRTIIQVQNAIERIGKSNIRLEIFYDSSTNKPHALNIGLGRATKDVIVVFDAEDEPNQDIYNVANTVMSEQNVDVLQSGVQLMNYRSTWFSTLNVLEYFFWFKSTLHFFAKSGIIPLGGNTVFFKKEKINLVSGWDEECLLTEDADIGIRLSVNNTKIQIVYDEKHVTKEESPLELSGFIKQRTRWSQGFLQILKKGDWLQLESVKLQLLAGYILLSPILQALFFLYIPFSVLIILFFKLPVWIVMISVIPLYILLLQLVTFNVGLYLFTKDYQLKYPFWMPAKIVFTFLPFQFILGLSSVRAVLRMFTKNNVWEKTQHVNAHRINQFQIRKSLQSATL